ncbi:hypothetical protein T484DRAFT_1871197, partial [Baffinella frigidus]
MDSTSTRYDFTKRKLRKKDVFVAHLEERPTKNHTPRRPPPAPIKARTTHLLYEVEKVVDVRMGKWGPEYLVKWKGYRTSDNTWIDEIPPFFRKESPFYKKEFALTDEGEDAVSDGESGSEDDSEYDAI